MWMGRRQANWLVWHIIDILAFDYVISLPKISSTLAYKKRIVSGKRFVTGYLGVKWTSGTGKT